jgi:hypothetical protein
LVSLAVASPVPAGVVVGCFASRFAGFTQWQTVPPMSWLDLDEGVTFVGSVTRTADELFDVVDAHDQPSPSLWLASRDNG